MTHDEIRKSLSAYHDGELPFLEMLALKTHLAICPECYCEVSRLRDLDALLTPPPAVTEREFEAAVMERIIADAPEADTRAVYTGWWKVPALALASCAIYALCVETGLLSTNQSQLLAAMTAHKEAERFSTMIFGSREAGSEQLLTMLLEGERK